MNFGSNPPPLLQPVHDYNFDNMSWRRWWWASVGLHRNHLIRVQGPLPSGIIHANVLVHGVCHSVDNTCRNIMQPCSWTSLHHNYSQLHVNFMTRGLVHSVSQHCCSSSSSMIQRVHIAWRWVRVDGAIIINSLSLCIHIACNNIIMENVGH